MRRLLILFVSLWIAHCVSAQTLSVSSFKAMPMDMDARVNHPVTDHNGKKCAIIKVENSNTGFAFDTGTLQVQKVEQQPGEIWVYVQPGVRKMTIRHQKLGNLREYPFPETIKEGAVYVMKLESGYVHTYVEQAPTGAYLVMRLEPVDAIVWIDDELQKNEDGVVTTFLNDGAHTYRVQAVGYSQEVGKVEINGERKDMQVVLQSNKAFLNLSCANPQAHLYIDGKEVGIGAWHGELIPGTHVVEVMLDGYRSQTRQVELNEKETVEHTFGPLVPINGYLQISSRPIDTEVWIDGKKVGTTPFGPEKLLIGTHQLELRKVGYQTFKKDITINEGETFLVNNPLEKEVGEDNIGQNFDTQTFTVNGVSFTMLLVNGGTFTMGSAPGQGPDDYSNEIPHRVTLSSYLIGQTEVTQALWQAVMGKNPSHFKGDNLPVEKVSWKDCQTFISKLNELTGKTFRLPTEAEWEYAARGGNKSKGYKYSGSNDLGTVAWYSINSSNKTHPVGTKQPNELGIYDMSGNVWEWCSDYYDRYSSAAVTNPTGPKIGSDRVYRGGSCGELYNYCRVYYRNCTYYNDPNYKERLGLRLALVPSNSSNNEEDNIVQNIDTQTFTVKGVSITMVPVEGGTFTMGATLEQGSDAFDDEKPAHRVTLSSYMIGQTEVTQALWQAVMGENPSLFEGDNLPVERVSWDDCQKFIKKLNRLTGRTFRLPTEAEWEYSARGGNKSKGYKYSGSNDWGKVAWTSENSSRDLHPVATKQPNELGIYDMSGNVWEWCNDYYASYSSAAVTKPTGPKNGSFRAYRGGSNDKIYRYSRVSIREYYDPDSHKDNLGLRLVLEP